MRYFKLTAYTPFCGEESIKYIKLSLDKAEKIYRIASDFAWENGLEWCDDDMLETYGMDEDEYFDECGCKVEEIDYNTYVKEWSYGS